MVAWLVGTFIVIESLNVSMGPGSAAFLRTSVFWGTWSSRITEFTAVSALEGGGGVCPIIVFAC